jgi:hypothetical protein
MWANFAFVLHSTPINTGPASGNIDSRLQELAVEKGTIHTKRHSGEDPIKSG